MTSAVRYKVAMTLMAIAGACFALFVIAGVNGESWCIAGLWTGAAFMVLALITGRRH